MKKTCYNIQTIFFLQGSEHVRSIIQHVKGKCLVILCNYFWLYTEILIVNWCDIWKKITLWKNYVSKIIRLIVVSQITY